jgi:hypothetical protein
LVIVHSPISCASACLGNEARETMRFRSISRGEEGWIPLDDESVSPNPERGELNSASLHVPLTANLPEMVKPVIGREEMNESTYRVRRGDWRERARKECAWYLGDPFRGRTLVVSGRQGRRGSHNPKSLRQRESDGPVVVLTRGNARRAKGSFRHRVLIKKGGAA